MSDVLPEIVDDNRAFWEGTLRGELRVQRCVDTGRLIFPPRPISPFGRHLAPEWTALSGRGKIWSFVVPHPPLLPGFAELAPYNVVLVELDEDPSIRLVGNLLAGEGGSIDEIDPQSIEIGAAVRVVFDRVSEDVALPRWVLV